MYQALDFPYRLKTTFSSYRHPQKNKCSVDSDSKQNKKGAGSVCWVLLLGLVVLLCFVLGVSVFNWVLWGGRGGANYLKHYLKHYMTVPIYIYI